MSGRPDARAAPGRPRRRRCPARARPGGCRCSRKASSRSTSSGRQPLCPMASVLARRRSMARTVATSKRRPDADRVADQQVLLEPRSVGRRDAHRGQVAEAGGHAVDRLAALDDGLDDRPTASHPGTSLRGQDRPGAVTGDGLDRLERQVVAGQDDGVRHARRIRGRRRQRSGLPAPISTDRPGRIATTRTPTMATTGDATEHQERRQVVVPDGVPAATLGLATGPYAASACASMAWPSGVSRSACGWHMPVVGVAPGSATKVDMIQRDPGASGSIPQLAESPNDDACEVGQSAPRPDPRTRARRASACQPRRPPRRCRRRPGRSPDRGRRSIQARTCRRRPGSHRRSTRPVRARRPPRDRASREPWGAS